MFCVWDVVVVMMWCKLIRVVWEFSFVKRVFFRVSFCFVLLFYLVLFLVDIGNFFDCVVFLRCWVNYFYCVWVWFVCFVVLIFFGRGFFVIFVSSVLMLLKLCICCLMFFVFCWFGVIFYFECNSVFWVFFWFCIGVFLCIRFRESSRVVCASRFREFASSLWDWIWVFDIFWFYGVKVVFLLWFLIVMFYLKVLCVLLFFWVCVSWFVCFRASLTFDFLCVLFVWLIFVDCLVWCLFL